MAEPVNPPQGPQGPGGGAAAAPIDPKYAWPTNPTVINSRLPRVDGPDKVTGRAKYTFDINRPGMLYGRIVRSPHPHARVVAVDLSAALRAPGVRVAVVHKDPASQANRAMFQGDEIAAVAADTEERAIDAARLIRVEYEVLPHVVNVDQALAGTAPAVFTGGNVRQGQVQEVGNLAAGFQAAAHTIEETYATQVITHVCMESHGTVCEWEGADRLTVWISTQGISGARENFATALNLPQANIRVICQHMGGGFGSKALSVGAEGLICARLAKEANAPVKLMLDRKEEHLAVGNRPSAAARIRAGVSADGRITAFDAQSWGTGGAGATAGFPLPYIYQIPNRRRSHRDVFINAGQQRPMRAPAHPQASFITEIMMDELAERANLDPIEFRLRNLPPESPNAMWQAYLREGAEAFGWNRRHATGDRTPGPIKTGMGVSLGTWGGGGRGPAPVRCEITADGAVVTRLGSQDLGTGTRTLITAITADSLGVPASRVRAEIGDSLYGVSPMSGGSVTAPSIAPAIRVAAINALDALKERVAPALGVDAASLVASAGRIHVRDNTARGLSWAEACKLIGPQPIQADGDWRPGLSSVTGNGAQFAEVTVDIETGIVKLTRILAIQDCGQVISRLTAESQCYGGVIGSLNYAMFEDRILDRNTGVMVNPNMEWYLLAGMSDIPQIEVRLKDQPGRGVVGVGEPPTVPTAAAIALAVRNAIGVTIRSLPLTPARILQALQTQRT